MNEAVRICKILKMLIKNRMRQEEGWRQQKRFKAVSVAPMAKHDVFESQRGNPKGPFGGQDSKHMVG